MLEFVRNLDASDWTTIAGGLLLLYAVALWRAGVNDEHGGSVAGQGKLPPPVPPLADQGNGRPGPAPMECRRLHAPRRA